VVEVSEQVEVRLLGPPGLVVDGAVVRLGARKERIVLVALALTAGRSVSESRLIEALWGEDPPPSATDSLRVYISRLRKSLHGTGITIESSAGGYELLLGPAGLDVALAERLGAEARVALAEGDAATASSRFTEAIALWHGASLGDVADEPTLRAEAARLEELRASLMEGRMEVELQLAHHDRVIGELESLCALWPHREHLWGLRMTALYRSGRQAEALQVYQDLRSHLVDELGIEPGPELRELELAILEQRVDQVVASGLVCDFPSLRTVDAVRHNLPIQRSTFVGRNRECVQVTSFLLAGRLVTLTGIGGCGKTRLALQVAAQMVEHFPQGIFFVDLAPVSDSALIGQAVAGALSLQLLDTRVDALAHYLSSRRALLIFDNCEHLLDGCSELIDELLAACPFLHVLATSREPLGVEGEQVFRVPSLEIETEAKTLFTARALAVRSNFDVNETTDRVIVEICRRLDGIPLAIELAAARTSHLTPPDILERLSDRFRLLTGGRRQVPRQQTLGAAIDWSYSMLSEEEKTLFRRLAVFRGGFSLRAAEQICHPDALDLLGSLVDKSLVALQGAEATARFRLLETVRLFAEDRLFEAGEADQLRSQHRDWFLAWIESFSFHELTVIGGGAVLDLEIDNLVAALGWSQEQQRPDLTTRIASRMIGYWWAYGRLAEMAVWRDELAGALNDFHPDLRASGLILGVQHAVATGTWDEMERLSAEMLTFAPAGSDLAAYAWTMQALYWTIAGLVRGRECIDEARTAFIEAGSPEYQSLLVRYFQSLLTGSESPTQALALFEDVLAGWGGDVRNDPVLTGMLALLGATARAAELQTSLPVESPLHRFHLEIVAALIASNEGRLEDMRAHIKMLVGMAREYAIPLGEESCLIWFAKLAIEEGNPAKASRLLASGSAQPFWFRTGLEMEGYRQCLNAVRASLDHAAIAECRAEGEAISVADALDAELASGSAQTRSSSQLS
jgi:predicted ATPase/DNA-binding SARP family transcriptional activator